MPPNFPVRKKPKVKKYHEIIIVEYINLHVFLHDRSQNLFLTHAGDGLTFVIETSCMIGRQRLETYDLMGSI